MKLTAILSGLSLSVFILGSNLSSADTLTPPPAPAPAPTAPAAATPTYDFGDGSSSVLTTKAWQSLEAKDYPAVAVYANKCIDSFKTQAVAMQATLKEPAPKESAAQLWALNDVGTCYYILGKSLDDQGDKKGAIAAYKFLVDNLSFAQCWDPKGWFWPPAGAAKKRLAELSLTPSKSRRLAFQKGLLTYDKHPFGDLCESPGGTSENSPAIYRRVLIHEAPSSRRDARTTFAQR